MAWYQGNDLTREVNMGKQKKKRCLYCGKPINAKGKRGVGNNQRDFDTFRCAHLYKRGYLELDVDEVTGEPSGYLVKPRLIGV